MAKVTPTTKELTKDPLPQGSGGGAISVPLPDFLTPAEGERSTGLDLVTQYIRPSRLKVIQKAALPPYSDLFFTGDVVIVPEMQRLAEIEKTPAMKSGQFGARFYFTPLFFYPEWCKWNPMALRGSAPAIIERTQNPKSRLAALAQNPETWFEEHPQFPNDSKERIRNVEHLNFIILLHGHEEYADQLICMGFSRGSHRSGTAFAGLLRKRKTKHICGNIFEARSVYQPDKGKGDWYNIEVSNPSEGAAFGPWVTDKAWYDRAVELHEMLKKGHASQQILVDLEDEDIHSNVIDADADAPY